MKTFVTTANKFINVTSISLPYLLLSLLLKNVGLHNPTNVYDLKNMLVYFFSVISFAKFYILVMFLCLFSCFPVETHFSAAAVMEFPHRDQ